ncbi:flagellar hook-length control protein FliK [Rhodocyclus tenuis]|uniref:flagellar hook-length control protein FliK n=1 Tax=Rhodocyclus tenuis TaxID=1066 RepID=UPI001906A596|nr:flagellar hook-length control protein FliK [Rhodocyclus tenuis]MBK1679967.1 hypothetical protein [Rhodocyclus tenuis]
MIPADIGGRTQLLTDPALKPVTPATPSQEISDKLSGLTSGQRVTAQIQALLPNGTYRAIVAQRDVTLALPFAAKSGDMLELEVVENNGKMALAVVSRQGSAATDATGKEAVATTLSRTGQLIADLFSGPQSSRGGSAALPLNGGQPLSNTPPASAAELLPQLKQAISQSGMFYESHQRGWVEGRVDKEQLLLEPQGRLSPAIREAAGSTLTPANTGNGSNLSGAREALLSSATANNTAAPAASNPPATQVAPETVQIVRQQLDSLATQQFNWQGQIWPGQQMNWQIAEEPRRDDSPDQQGGGIDDEAPEWRTQMRLTLPRLGEIDARIGLRGNGIRLDIAAGDAETQATLQAAVAELQQQLNRAGLSLTAFGVGDSKPDAAEVRTDAGQGT